MHYHIVITNHAGGKIDVGSLPAMVAAPHPIAPGILPTPALDQQPTAHLGYRDDDLLRTLALKEARTSSAPRPPALQFMPATPARPTPTENPAPADQIPQVSLPTKFLLPRPPVAHSQPSRR